MPLLSERRTDVRLMARKSSALTRMFEYLTRSAHAASSSGRGGPRYGFSAAMSSLKSIFWWICAERAGADLRCQFRPVYKWDLRFGLRLVRQPLSS